jgi:AP-2 complex subunit alpha
MDFALFSSQPRGLHNFISEIRSCHTKDEERSRVDKELANIRNKFASPANLTSYDKKKYVWKLCYIYMLGYEVDFGHVEFISLLSSTKFQEKAVGYMAFSMMFRPGDELMTLAVNSMRNDIIGQLSHGQTLALAAVSNMGGNDLAEALSGDVQRLIVSPLEAMPSYRMGPDADVELRNKSLTAKKASICLLRLFRTNPECVVMEEWMKRLAKLLEDRDLGVLTAILSLLLGFASHAPAAFEPLVPYVISVLTRLVVNRTCPGDYLYYNTPSPWIQVKCLRFLQYYKIPEDNTQVELLNDSMTKVLSRNDFNESNNKSNADHAVLFEAVNLLISYGSDCPAHLRDHAATLLGKFVSTKDANIRYLGIETMTRLAKLEGPQVAEHYQTDVLDSLKDPDISLRKRALNLLYVMCYEKNARDIVGELVINLPTSDSQIKEDIVVKIAILAEKYHSGDLRWYFDSMIQVILLAGDYVAEAVWFRVIQVVTNNPDIHEYAAEKCLTVVQSKFTHETLVGLSGYLLGEIGVNICERPGMSGYDQFTALHNHFANASVKTQSILLTAFMKLLNLYPDQITEAVLAVFRKFSSSSHLELQQRSWEYFTLSGLPTAAQLQEAVFNTMPPFPMENKENILLAMESTEQKTADRPAWAVGEGEKEASRAALGKGGDDSKGQRRGERQRDSFSVRQ